MKTFYLGVYYFENIMNSFSEWFKSQSTLKKSILKATFCWIMMFLFDQNEGKMCLIN